MAVEEKQQEPQWYVLSTLFGYENIVKRNLMQMVEPTSCRITSSTS